jgi:hypothetical protein
MLEKKDWYVGWAKFYQEYRLMGGTLSSKSYKKILDLIMYKVSQYLLDGFLFRFTSIGTFAIIKIERDFEKLRIDWGNSIKYKEYLMSQGKDLFSDENPNGEKWLVYFTDEYYYRLVWLRTDCKSKGVDVYKFKLSNKVDIFHQIHNNKQDVSFAKRFALVPSYGKGPNIIL